jgi:hypothetical protein
MSPIVPPPRLRGVPIVQRLSSIVPLPSLRGVPIVQRLSSIVPPPSLRGVPIVQRLSSIVPLPSLRGVPIVQRLSSIVPPPRLRGVKDPPSCLCNGWGQPLNNAAPNVLEDNRCTIGQLSTNRYTQSPDSDPRNHFFHQARCTDYPL